MKDIKKTIIAAVTEIRGYFSKDIGDAYKLDIYANIDGELFVIMPYKKFLKWIEQHSKNKSEIGLA